MIPQNQLPLPLGSVGTTDQNFRFPGIPPGIPPYLLAQASLPISPAQQVGQFSGLSGLIPHQMQPPIANGGFESYASPQDSAFSSGVNSEYFASNGAAHNGSQQYHHGNFAAMTVDPESEQVWSEAPKQRSAHTPNFHHTSYDEAAQVLWTTPSPGGRPSPGSRAHVNGSSEHAESTLGGGMDELDSLSNDILPAGSLASPGQGPLNDSELKNSKAVVRRKPARKAVYKWLRDVCAAPSLCCCAARAEHLVTLARACVLAGRRSWTRSTCWTRCQSGWK